MDDVVHDFLLESHENLERLDQAFVALEQDPGDRKRVDAIFRAIHTVKGASGFLGFTRLQALTHSGENYLSRLRDGAAAFTSEAADALLALVDAVRAILRAIEASDGAGEGDADIAPLTARLDTLASGRTAPPAAMSAPAPALDPFEAELAATAAALRERDGEPAPAPEPEPAITHRVPAAPAKPAETAPPATATRRVDGETAAPAEASASVADSTVRVDVKVLDRLMNLVGELVLTRNRLLQHVGQGADPVQQGLAQTLNHLTGELQDGVMKTRMQPISTLWSKLPRVVRDLARGCGKALRVEQEGADTELDRSLIEALKDPMTHIVRNAVDHGIEMPDARVKAGKPAEGVLRLRAHAESGHVVIEVEDDGRGIDPARVKAKAVEKGLITAEQAQQLADREAVELVFLPGFSTAEQVTNLSGRGVGMDVVKSNLGRLGGRIELRSVPGRGTVLHMTVPLTLAIVPALLVAAGDAVFALPQRAVLELLRQRRDEAAAFAEIYGARFLRLRGELLPLVDLRALLGRTGRDPVPTHDPTTTDSAPGSANAPERAGGPEVVPIVVLQALGQRFALVVDAIHATEEIVVKPLGKAFAGIAAYAGATILGDGRLALVLDPGGVGRLGHAFARRGDEVAAVAAETVAEPTARREPLLLFEGADGGRVAVPVADVLRIEEIERGAIEHVGGREVVQYRGGIMPVVRFAEDGDAARLQLVVHERGGRCVGLLVGRVLDTVEAGETVADAIARPGVRGCVVVQERVTELVDVAALAAQAGG